MKIVKLKNKISESTEFNNHVFTLKNFAMAIGLIDEMFDYEFDQVARAEGWLQVKNIVDDYGNIVDYEITIDKDAIKDTLKRMGYRVNIDTYESNGEYYVYIID